MKGKFVPQEIFEQILEWSVIPTFDLVVETNKGVILARRKIAPYKNQWALPGLRMMKGESIENALERISKRELGIEIDANNRVFLGQYVGRFRTEHRRQDISTGYLVSSLSQKVELNKGHFSSIKFIKRRDEIPTNAGTMYQFYLNEYFDMIE